MAILIRVYENTPEALIDPDATPVSEHEFADVEAASEWLEVQPYPSVMEIDVVDSDGLDSDGWTSHPLDEV